MPSALRIKELRDLNDNVMFGQDKLVLPVGTSDPSSTAQGSTYYNTNSDELKIYGSNGWASVSFLSLGNYVTDNLYSYWDVSSISSYDPNDTNTLYDLEGNQNLGNSGDTPVVQGTNVAKYFVQSSEDYPYWTVFNRNFGLGDVSIEMWAFTTGRVGDDYLFNFSSGGSGGQSRALRMTSGLTNALSFVGNGSSDQDQNDIVSLTSNQWYQFVLTLSSYNNLTVYLNGSSQGSFTKVLNDGGSGNVYIGNTFWYGANDPTVWRGGWALCRFYTKTLTSVEVATNWNGTKSRFGY